MDQVVPLAAMIAARDSPRSPQALLSRWHRSGPGTARAGSGGSPRWGCLPGGLHPELILLGEKSG